MTAISDQPTYQSVQFSFNHFLRQAVIASLFVIAIAAYSSSHPVSYQTAKAPVAPAAIAP